MKLSITAVIIVSIGLYCVPLVASGAPVRVHLFDAGAMLLAFTIPNLLIASITRKALAWTVAIALNSAATIAWHVLLPLVIAKAEPSMATALMLLPLSIAALCVHTGFAFVASHCTHFFLTRKAPSPKDFTHAQSKDQRIPLA